MPLFAPKSLILLVAAISLACGGDTILESEFDLDRLAEADQFAVLVNEHRVAIGCSSLALDPSINSVASKHSLDMVERGYFAHTNPDGQNPFDRLADADINYSRAGENIAAGQTSAQQVLNDWLNSSGHRANIENCAYTHHGIGLVDNYWTHLFVTPR